MIDDGVAFDFEVVWRVDELARCDRLPRRILIDSFAGHDDRRLTAKVGGADANTAVLADAVEVLVAVVATGVPIKQVQLVGVPVAQRPQVSGRDHDQVEGQDRYVLGEPSGRGGDPRSHFAVTGGSFFEDEREYPLRVGVATHEPSVVTAVAFEDIQAAQSAVVGEGHVAFDDGMSVLL
jgi:hypothetical protein